MFISNDVTNIYVLESICSRIQTYFGSILSEMRFGVEQLLFPEGMRCKNELFYSKSHFSLHVSAKQRRYIVWFHKYKTELKYFYIRLQMLSSTLVLVKSVEMNIFHVNNRRAALCLSQGRRMGSPALHNNSFVGEPFWSSYHQTM